MLVEGEHDEGVQVSDGLDLGSAQALLPADRQEVFGLHQLLAVRDVESVDVQPVLQDHAGGILFVHFAVHLEGFLAAD